MWAKTKYIGGEMKWYIWPYLISNKDIEIVYSCRFCPLNSILPRVFSEK